MIGRSMLVARRATSKGLGSIAVVVKGKHVALARAGLRACYVREANPGIRLDSHHNLRWFSDKTEDKKEEKVDDEPEMKKEEETTAESGDKQGEETAEEELSREEALEIEVKELKDQLLRSLAEQDNIRRIAQRDVQSAREFAIKSFAKSLLDVSDNLSRALESVPEEHREDKEGNPVLATLYEGIKMTDEGLTRSFEANGLVKFGEPGEEFDPNKHSALFEVPDPDKEAGTVSQLVKVGFMLNNRVLRPAEVGVVKK